MSALFLYDTLRLKSTMLSFYPNRRTFRRAGAGEEPQGPRPPLTPIGHCGRWPKRQYCALPSHTATPLSFPKADLRRCKTQHFRNLTYGHVMWPDRPAERKPRAWKSESYLSTAKIFSSQSMKPNPFARPESLSTTGNFTGWLHHQRSP